MKNKLIELANELDKKGLAKEADFVNSVLQKIANSSCCGENSIESRLTSLSDHFSKNGLKKAHESIKNIIEVIAKKRIPEDKEKMARLKKRYMNDKGEFKGRAGEKFDNCIKYQLARDEAGIYGFKLKIKKGRTKEDAAEALCAAIKRRKYGCLTENDVIILKAHEDFDKELVVTARDLEESGLVRVAVEKGEELEPATPSEAFEGYKKRNPKWDEGGSKQLGFYIKTYKIV